MGLAYATTRISDVPIKPFSGLHEPSNAKIGKTLARTLCVIS